MLSPGVFYSQIVRQMQSSLSTFDDAIFSFEDLALVLIICCFRQISLVTPMHGSINYHHPFSIRVNVSYIRQQNCQNCPQFYGGVHEWNAAQTYKSYFVFFSNSGHFFSFIVGNWCWSNGRRTFFDNYSLSFRYRNFVLWCFKQKFNSVGGRFFKMFICKRTTQCP